jgi:5-methylcytosine-specific restriction endonuclease McrA
MSRVLVLNASYEPLHVTTVKRAVVLLLREKAEAVEHTERVLRAETLVIAYPAVIRLVTYVRIPRSARRRLTRRAIIARDEGRCQYCGSTSSLTIDHVVPRSKGGKHAWTNVVAACSACNHKKGDAYLRDVGMKLARQPTYPSSVAFVYIAVPYPPTTWEQYL